MDPVNLLGVLLGMAALALIALAVFRGEFREIEKPKYEMLGREPPPGVQSARPGCLGIEDRIIRLGLAIAGGYYASRFGWETPVGVVLAVLALYLGVTALLARDYLYKIFHIDTRLPEHRG